MRRRTCLVARPRTPRSPSGTIQIGGARHAVGCRLLMWTLRAFGIHGFGETGGVFLAERILFATSRSRTKPPAIPTATRERSKDDDIHLRTTIITKIVTSMITIPVRGLILFELFIIFTPQQASPVLAGHYWHKSSQYCSATAQADIHQNSPHPPVTAVHSAPQPTPIPRQAALHP